MKQNKVTDEIRRMIAAAVNSNHLAKSDPFLFGRVLTHYKNGLIDLADIKAGNFS